jgi:DNA recombination protein RmuC
VMKEQAKRVRAYIQPENGTTDIALMYLPSETLYMEAVRNRELSDELNKMKVFPVSPNSLLVTLNAVAMVHKWYQVQKGLAKSIEEFGKAKKTLEHFESKFEVIGKSLDKAREAYDTANTHLSRFKSRVTSLSGDEQLGLEDGEEPQKSLGAGAS